MTAETMTSRERMLRMLNHQEADRVPVCGSPWPATLDRWRREGMPAGADYREFFGLDIGHHLTPDCTPRYPWRLVEETEDWITAVNSWGVTLRNWKHSASTPEYLDFTITTPDAWREAKARMAPADDRVDWAWLERTYPRIRERGEWFEAGLWFGFDVTHSWAVGTERVLMAMLEEPEWMADMFATELDLSLAMADRIWERGYRFDAVSWPDDMGYKGHQFFSVATYREFLKPLHRRVAGWARAKGIKTRLHSCGDVRPFVAEFVDAGIDELNPLEVKAGMDPLALKRAWGRQLALHGGINALLWDKPEAVAAEMRRVMPALKEGGGYVFDVDHSIPSSVGVADFRRIVALAKELGSYR